MLRSHFSVTFIIISIIHHIVSNINFKYPNPVIHSYQVSTQTVMQQFSVFQTTHVSHGTPPLRGGVNSAWLGSRIFQEGSTPPPMGLLDKPLHLVPSARGCSLLTLDTKLHPEMTGTLNVRV